jgi:hypothetical protein
LLINSDLFMPFTSPPDYLPSLLSVFTVSLKNIHKTRKNP